LSKQYTYLGDEWGDESFFRNIVESFIRPYLKKDDAVLEIGPGGGRYTSYLADLCSRVDCVDVSGLMLDRIKTRFKNLNHISCFKGNGKDLAPIGAESIDFAFSFNVFVQLEFEDLVNYLFELKRVLKPGGTATLNYASISTPNGWEYFVRNCSAWMNEPKPRGRFCELSVDMVDNLAEHLCLEVLRNEHLDRDGVLVFRKPDQPERLSTTTKSPDSVQDNISTSPGISVTGELPRQESLRCPIILPKHTVLLFITGSMKSGTTWLMNALDAHPDICCKGEMHPVEQIDVDALPRPNPTLESLSLNLGSLREWFMAENNAWSLPFRAGGMREQVFRDMERDFVRFMFEWTIHRYLTTVSDRIPRVIGDKTPSHSSFTARKLSYYFNNYNTHIVHLVRDPRDVAVSRWFFTRRLQHKGLFQWVRQFENEEDKRMCELLMNDESSFATRDGRFFHYEGFLEDVFREWINVNEHMHRDGKRLFGKRFMMVKYEDMKTGFDEVMSGILQWLKVDSSEEVIKLMDRSSNPATAAEVPFVFRKGNSGDWMQYFGPKDIELFEKMVLPVSRDYGYL